MLLKVEADDANRAKERFELLACEMLGVRVRRIEVDDLATAEEMDARVAALLPWINDRRARDEHPRAGHPGTAVARTPKEDTTR